MFGAILGDIAGSRFEFTGNRVKPKELFTPTCFTTDDTYLTEAVAESLMSGYQSIEELKKMVLALTIRQVYRYPDAGWGTRFLSWIENLVSANHIRDIEHIDPKQAIDYRPNASAGNGAAMKISPVAYFASDLEECKLLSKAITSVTHDHPDSYKAAESLTTAIYLALRGASKDELRSHILAYYPEVAGLTYAQLNKQYRYTELAKDSMPTAFACFLDSSSFEESLANAVSIGGDADTLGAITGALSEAYYGWGDFEKEVMPVLFGESGKPGYRLSGQIEKSFLLLMKGKFPRLYQSKVFRE